MIDDVNFDREYNRLLETMKAFKLSEGTIVTLNQTDHFENDGLSIRMIPAYEFMQE